MSILEKIKNAGQLSPESITGVFSNVNLSPVWMMFKVFIFVIITVIILAVIYKYWIQYNILIHLKHRIGNSVIISYDRAKIINPDEHNKRKMILLKNRNGKQSLTCPVPENIFLQIQGRKKIYELWMDDNKQLHPIHPPQIIYKEDMITPEAHPYLFLQPEDRSAFVWDEINILHEKYKKKSLLETYLPAGILIISMITAFLIWFFATKELGSGMQYIGSSLVELAKLL